LSRRLVSVIGSLAVVVALFAAIQAATSGPETYTVTAEVEQAPNLFEGGRVMVRGVKVGTISQVEPTPSGVRLTLEIESRYKVPADATLVVIPITVIADRYVQLVPAYSGGPALEEGTHIPIEQTAIPAELDDVLEQLKGLLSALEPRRGEETGPLARLVVALDAAVNDRSDQIGGTIESSAIVLGGLAESEEDITGLISNLDRLFLALANRASEIGIVNERFALVAESLANDQENLEGTIENLSLLAEEAAGLLRDSGDDIGRSFGRLGRVLRAVLARQDELAKGVRWANVIAQALGATDSSGRGLYAYSGKQARPEYSYRLDARDTIACERIGALAESLIVLQPSTDIDDVMETLLSFIPDEYDEDLSFLLRQLVPLCSSVHEAPALQPQHVDELTRIVDQVGEERFVALVARWFAQNYAEAGRG